jgi:hypothetical protein
MIHDSFASQRHEGFRLAPGQRPQARAEAGHRDHDFQVLGHAVSFVVF